MGKSRYREQGANLMAEQWLTIRFNGEKALREQLAHLADEFLKSHDVPDGFIREDELPDGPETAMVGLANNETTIGPLE